MVILNQLNKNFPAILFEMLYYTYACDAYLGFYLNLKCTFFISTRYKDGTAVPQRLVSRFAHKPTKEINRK